MGTRHLGFDLTISASGSTRHCACTAALSHKFQTSRIAGGMHLHKSVVDGAALHRSAGDRVRAFPIQSR